MKMHKSTLAAAITAALALGAAGPAAANIYGVSYLHIDDVLIITLNDDGSSAPAGTFNFNAINTAFLNGAGEATNDVCAGVFGGANDCGPAGARLDAAPANGTGGDVTRLDNVFNFFGPGTDQYSNADSLVARAQLTGDGRTETRQIAESELQDGSSASANAEIASTTGFTFTFTLMGTGSLTLSFDADPRMMALINEGVPGNYAAESTLNATFDLRRDAGGVLVNWAPRGTALVNDCLAVGATCVETDDSQDLNLTLGVTTDGETATHGFAGFTPFGISVTGLSAGTYTLTLAVKTSTLLTRQQVPEPGLLALLGIGLAGLGVMRRRKQVS
ncbi:MAG TPA: EDSAP-1 family PEP-CTERM protein [Azoarcus taiwanensis]|nr:EDSAP-1 family PEP-CTERM protein [Azoarcus taiwanensis]